MEVSDTVVHVWLFFKHPFLSVLVASESGDFAYSSVQLLHVNKVNANSWLDYFNVYLLTLNVK